MRSGLSDSVRLLPACVLWGAQRRPAPPPLSCCRLIACAWQMLLGPGARPAAGGRPGAAPYVQGCRAHLSSGHGPRPGQRCCSRHATARAQQSRCARSQVCRMLSTSSRRLWLDKMSVVAHGGSKTATSCGMPDALAYGECGAACGTAACTSNVCPSVLVPTAYGRCPKRAGRPTQWKARMPPRRRCIRPTRPRRRTQSSQGRMPSRCGLASSMRRAITARLISTFALLTVRWPRQSHRIERALARCDRSAMRQVRQGYAQCTRTHRSQRAVRLTGRAPRAAQARRHQAGASRRHPLRHARPPRALGLRPLGSRVAVHRHAAGAPVEAQNGFPARVRDCALSHPPAARRRRRRQGVGQRGACRRLEAAIAAQVRSRGSVQG